MRMLKEDSARARKIALEDDGINELFITNLQGMYSADAG